MLGLPRPSRFALLLLPSLLLLAGGLEASPILPTESGKWDVPVWGVLPFLAMLLCIAVIPLVNHHWWENNRNRGLVSALLGVPVLVFTLWQAENGGGRVLHTGQEYFSFIFLLGSLFIISGGIVITGNLVGTPRVNTFMLAVGGLLASFIGTTGAAMVLIRALLKTNSERKHKLHTVIFFIFIVCNCGGCLTPLGDPPLFLGYLKGVPFTWTFSLWPQWLFVCGCLLGVYFVLDTIQHRKETRRDLRLDVEHEKPIVIRGGHNFLFLGGIVASVAYLELGYREAIQLLLTLWAFFSTRPSFRKENGFTFGPILEVVVVFAGIFATMIPALALLETRGGKMGLGSPMSFFWATGTLSSFLDNAPTYLSFLALAKGIPMAQWSGELLQAAIAFGPGMDAIEGLSYQAALEEVQRRFPGGSRELFVMPVGILTSISCGAVFMGSMTYIGNGPNFMVRAIADESGIKMPSFFGFMCWSGVFLIPILVLLNLWF